MLIGYARVSTDEQSTASQAEELRAAGCRKVYEENASGGDRTRPVLRRLIEELKAGDIIVVVRLDRLARSLSHLLEVIEGLETRGIHFRSLRDPVDTTSPQGKFTLQVLGAAAELERALIRDRTMSGLKSARAKGRVGGNPGLVSKDKATLRKLVAARDETHMEKLLASADQWVATVRRLRPRMTWEDVTRQVNAGLPPDAPKWSMDRLIRATRRYVREGMMEASVLERAKPERKKDRLEVIVASIVNAQPDITLQEVCNRLEKMREKTPRGRSGWYPSSVRNILERARKLGLVDPPEGQDP